MDIVFIFYLGTRLGKFGPVAGFSYVHDSGRIDSYVKHLTKLGFGYFYLLLACHSDKIGGDLVLISNKVKIGIKLLDRNLISHMVIGNKGV